MPFADDPQRLWVNRFTGGKAPPFAPVDALHPTPDESYQLFQIARAKEEAADQRKKEILLDETHKAVALEKAKLHKAFVFMVKSKGKELSSLGERGDQRTTFDSDAAVEDLDEAVDSSRTNLMIQATDVLKKLEVKLSSAVTTRTRWDKAAGQAVVDDKAPLFEKNEVMDELYDPLVRGLVIPENFVPNEYSKTKQMLDESNDFYLKELEDKEDEKEDESFEDMKSVVTALSGLAVAVVPLVPGSKEALETAVNLTKLATAVMTTAIDASSAVSKQEALSGTQGLISNLGGIFSSVIEQTTGNKEAGKLIALAMKGAADVGAIVAFLAQDEPEMDGVIENLGAAIVKGIELAQPKDPLAATISASAVEAVFKGLALAKKDDLINNVKAKRWSEVQGTLVKIGGQALKSAMDVARVAAKPEKEKPKDEEGAPKGQDSPSKPESEAPESEGSEDDESGKEDTDEKIDELVKLAEEHFKEKSEELKEKAKKLKEEAQKEMADDAADLEKRLAEDQEKYEKMLSSLGPPDANVEELKSIATLIGQIQKDRAILSAVAAVSSAGCQVASEFFAPMALAGTLVKFLASVTAAAQRAMALRKWVDARGEAVSAVSPYRSSIENFVKNQKEQFAHHTIKACLNLVEAGAHVATLSGVAAPVSAVVGASVKLAETAEDQLYKFYDARAVKAAWELTEKSFNNPNNRKLGLVVREQNATLAKYSIAYGAVVRKDPIALSAMGKCGLDRETLAQKGSNVEDVKKFLQTLYSEDSEVFGEYEPKGWSNKPPASALTVKSWFATFRVARENDRFEDDNPPAIKKLMKKVEANARIPQARLAKPQFDEFIIDLTALEGAFAAFQPRKAGGVVATESIRVFKNFRDLAEAELASMTAARDKL